MSKAFVRCAVYTRKSSDEGLDQSFNSIEAQQEACRAFISSQKHEGWVALPERYDDGGFSGGNMERPALARLLADIQAGMIDTVVVYKVDRLTRSLADFAKMIEIFDSRSASFVSVTQQFNTTSSRGRLTLNVLLSFAQFEREITGERIRDKIAASKKKGMWMGGNVPLGYDRVDRRLVVNESEAEAVRTIFRQYLRLGGVSQLKQYADQKKIYTKIRKKSSRSTTGGRPFSRGALHHLLRNKIYVGEIVHKSCSHPGQHEPIIERKLWEQVARRLSQKNRGHRTGKSRSTPALLMGILFDVNGVRYTPTHAVKKGKRYRYYTSQTVISGAGEKPRISRLPADPLEQLVRSRLHQLIESSEELARDAISPDLEKTRMVAERLSKAWHIIHAEKQIEIARAVVKRVTLGASTVWILVSRKALIEKLLSDNFREDTVMFSSEQITVSTEFRGIHRGATQQMKEQIGGFKKAEGSSLLATLARARVWYERILNGEVDSVEALAREVKMTPRFIRRVLRWATLSPRVVESIAGGRFRANLAFGRIPTLPLAWKEQERFLAPHC